jgi:hypothetical protein
MAMSEFIRNLDVSFEMFLLLRIDFTYYAKVHSPKVERQEQTTFDLPVRKPQPIQKVKKIIMR